MGTWNPLLAEYRAMIESLRLPFTFDAASLREDLERIPADRWIAHFVKENYDGDWSGVALRGPADVTHPIQQLFANPGTENWANTDLLDLCPYFAEVLSHFQCPLQSVRLLRLAPGSVIKEHRDHALGYEDGEVRVHVPIQTSPAVEFWLNGKRVVLRAGETWYLNVNLPHRVENRGEEYRVHMVIDCEVDGWMRGVFEDTEGERAAAETRG